MDNELYLDASNVLSLFKKILKNDTRKYKTVGNPDTETAMKYREQL
jgi:hypothetical protein